MLQVIHPEAFCGLKHLERLYLHGNKLSIAPPMDPVKTTLRQLSLDRNVISQIPNNYFQTFSQLHAIRIARNNLSYFPNLHCLEKFIKAIHVKSNRIESLNELLQQGFYESLEYIDATRNTI